MITLVLNVQSLAIEIEYLIIFNYSKIFNIYKKKFLLKDL